MSQKVPTAQTDMLATQIKRVVIVPHTHWDREWYEPFTIFRAKLGRMVDDLIDALENDPRLVFTLDGQSVILEDYLELRPDQEKRFRALFTADRIAIGPEYVLPDEFLAGQEALVRNFLIGKQTCERYGGRPMRIGYLADTFGHVAQLPQILRQFGHESFVFARGLGNEGESLGAVFFWRAPDGSTVRAIRQLGHYDSADLLGERELVDGQWIHYEGTEQAQAAARRITRFLERYSAQFAISGIDTALMCNGTDHRWIQRSLPRILDECAPHFPQTRLEIGTYERYIDLVSDAENLQTYGGEMCAARYAYYLRGINSTRMYLKIRNAAAERQLLIAEALGVLAHLKAGNTYAYPFADIRLAWREFLKNQAHDSIGGCSIDAVHRDMLHRYETVERLTTLVRDEALEKLKTDEDDADDGSLTFSAVNILPWKRTHAIQMELPEAFSRTRHVVLESPDGPLPVQLDAVHGKRRLTFIAEVLGLSSKELRLQQKKSEVLNTAVRATAPSGIENEFYGIEAYPDGTIGVTDKRTGETWKGFHRLVSEGDRGDEYDYSPAPDDVAWESTNGIAKIKVLSSGPVVAELQIDLHAKIRAKLNHDRRARSKKMVVCPIRTIVRLAHGIDRVEFQTTVTNRAKDHRLRVIFPAPGSNQTVRVEGHYAVLRRPAVPENIEGWVQTPITTHHTQGMITAGSVAVFTRGLTEYEALPRSDGGVDLAITLLRCVGWLSRDDLLTRPEHAGPMIATPDAQCLGTYTFEYALSFCGEDDDTTLIRAAQNYRMDYVVVNDRIDLDGMLGVDGKRFAFGALKGAEDGNGVILRLYNPGAEPGTVNVHGKFHKTETCLLDETTSRPSTSPMAIGPYEIKTFHLK